MSKFPQEVPIELIDKTIAGMIGQKIYEVRIGIGNALSLEMGERLRGLCGCFWKLLASKGLLATVDSKEGLIKASLDKLIGTSITDLRISHSSQSTIFDLTEGLQLEALPWSVGGANVDSYWELFTPGMSVLWLEMGL